MPKSNGSMVNVVTRTEISLALTELHLKTCAERWARAIDTQGEDEAWEALEAASLQHTVAYLRENA